MTTHDYMIDIINTVSEWEGVQVHAHRFGGREFKVGNVEIGHVHRGGMLDIPFPKRIHDVLLREGKTGAHHILPDTGWTTFYTRTESDLHQAIWLLRLSYVQKAWRRMPDHRANLQRLLDNLDPGDELHALIDSHSA